MMESPYLINYTVQPEHSYFLAVIYTAQAQPLAE